MHKKLISRKIASNMAENIKMDDDINSLSHLLEHGISKKVFLGMYSIVNEVIENPNINKKMLMRKSSLSNENFESFVGDLEEFKEIIGVDLPECDNNVFHF
ncbi:hypothetical protein VSAK1_26085 [Vibrio mediterranei AK1]|nr:hypothetical protein VSAK1_26085 [Vibrio mediterranei AK1]